MIYLKIIIYFFQSLALATTPDLIELRNEMCTQQNANFVKHIHNKNDTAAYIQSNILFSKTPFGMDFFEKEFAQSNIENTALVDSDKILYVNFLINSRDTNFTKMKEMLDFNNSDKVINAYNSYYQGLIEIHLKNNIAGLTKIEEAIKLLPFVDSFMLTDYLAYSQNEQDRTTQTSHFLNLVEKVPNTDPQKKVLLLYKKIISAPKSQNLEISDLDSDINEIFQACSVDLNNKFLIGYLFYSTMRIQQAHDIFLQIAKYKYYPVDVDFFLVMTHFALNKPKEAQVYFDKSIKAFPYLSKEDQKLLLQYKIQQPKKLSFNYMTTIVVFVQILLIYLIYKYYRKRKK